MRKHGFVNQLLNASAAGLSLFVSTSCRDGGLPPQAIFHRGGSQALHSSPVNPDNLLVRELVYVPVYSAIHWGKVDTVTELSATLSVRNVDSKQSLVLVSVKYHDSLGNLLHEYLDGVMQLDPMATVEFVIERSDTRGGNGANFMVEWGAPGAIAEPVLESVMLGQIGTAGISFLSQGRAVRIKEPPVAPGAH